MVLRNSAWTGLIAAFSPAKRVVARRSASSERLTGSYALAQGIVLRRHRRSRPHLFSGACKDRIPLRAEVYPHDHGNEGAFRVLREFIRDGSGNHEQFLTRCDTVFESLRASGTPVAAVAKPDSTVVVNMQFFWLQDRSA